jgi:hypothetical protein
LSREIREEITLVTSTDVDWVRTERLFQLTGELIFDWKFDENFADSLKKTKKRHEK